MADLVMHKWLLAECKRLVASRDDILLHPELGVFKTLYCGDPGFLYQEAYYGCLANELELPWLVRTTGLYRNSEDTGPATFSMRGTTFHVDTREYIGMPFLNLEYVAGTIPLSNITGTYVARGSSGRHPFPQNFHFFRIAGVQILAALELLRYHKNLWHNDPHGENVLCQLLDEPETVSVDLPAAGLRLTVRSRFRMVLIDFGQATQLDDSHEFVLNSLAHMHFETEETHCLDETFYTHAQSILAFEFKDCLPSHFFLSKTFTESICLIAGADPCPDDHVPAPPLSQFFKDSATSTTPEDGDWEKDWYIQIDKLREDSI